MSSLIMKIKFPYNKRVSFQSTLTKEEAVDIFRYGIKSRYKSNNLFFGTVTKHGRIKVSIDSSISYTKFGMSYIDGTISTESNTTKINLRVFPPPILIAIQIFLSIPLIFLIPLILGNVEIFKALFMIIFYFLILIVPFEIMSRVWANSAYKKVINWINRNSKFRKSISNSLESN